MVLTRPSGGSIHAMVEVARRTGGQVAWPQHDAAAGVPDARDDDAWCKMHNPDPLLQMHELQD